MPGIIYLATNLLNGKKYVGFTSQTLFSGIYNNTNPYTAKKLEKWHTLESVK